MKLTGRFVVGVAALVLSAVPALATWSICVVNTRTGEACVASATCLDNFNLKKALPVLRPGLGCGASQASIDTTGINRQTMYNGLGAGVPPQQILSQLLAMPSAQTRQFGIVDFANDPASFSGSQTLEANPTVTGIVGDLRYAIQGNILAGDEPVLFAEQALLNTSGDLSQRVMAAMEAARFWGGDGRCSCSPTQPTSCPLPPPPPFKSAHVGFILLARIGDTGGGMCNATAGCATGNFYLSINIVGTATDPDPVITMEQLYAQWRASLAGRPDHILTRVASDAAALVADNKSKASISVSLRDIDDLPITHGGATLTLTNLSGSSTVTIPSAVVDHGDGTYSFTLAAGNATGGDTWRIVVDDGIGPVTLHPDLSVRVDPLVPLHVGYDAISAAAGTSVSLVVNVGGGNARRPYLLLASNAGTAPGLPFAGTQLPLNASSLLSFTYLNPNSVWLPGTFGKLDRTGRGEAHFAADPSMLAQLAGTHVDWSAVIFHPLGSSALAPVGFDVWP